MDKINRTNRERWNALARANVPYTRPFLDYTRQQAAEYVGRYGILKNVKGHMSTVLNSLAQNGFIFLGLWEYMRKERDPEPGSWPHFTQVAPPWFDTF